MVRYYVLGGKTMKLKKILSAIVVGALSLSMLVGCGTHADTKEMMKIFNDALSYNDTEFQKDLSNAVADVEKELNESGFNYEGHHFDVTAKLNLNFKTNTAKNSNELNNTARAALTQLQGAYKDGDTMKSLLGTKAVHDELVKTVVKSDNAIYVMSYVKLRDFKSNTFNAAKTLLQMSEMFANVPYGVAQVSDSTKDAVINSLKDVLKNSQVDPESGAVKVAATASLKTGDTMQVGFAEGQIGDSVYLISVMKVDVEVTVKGTV